jgi:hypothetical protein
MLSPLASAVAASAQSWSRSRNRASFTLTGHRRRLPVRSTANRSSLVEPNMTEVRRASICNRPYARRARSRCRDRNVFTVLGIALAAPLQFGDLDDPLPLQLLDRLLVRRAHVDRVGEPFRLHRQGREGRRFVEALRRTLQDQYLVELAARRANAPNRGDQHRPAHRPDELVVLSAGVVDQPRVDPRTPSQAGSPSGSR